MEESSSSVTLITKGKYKIREMSCGKHEVQGGHNS